MAQVGPGVRVSEHHRARPWQHDLARYGKVGATRGRDCRVEPEPRVLEPYVLYEGWSITERLDLVADERANAHDWMELGGLFVEGMSR